MDDLKGSINLQAYAQRDPVTEYRMQGADMFDEMVAEIRERTVRRILSIAPRVEATQRVEVAKVTGEGFEGGVRSSKKVSVSAQRKAPSQTPIVKTSTVGPNDPCPCGSGKKFKKCCKGAQSGNNANV